MSEMAGKDIFFSDQQPSQNIEDSEGRKVTASQQRQDNQQQGRWTQQEHIKFVEALGLYGKNWKKVEEHVESRSGPQIRSHAQKYFNRLEREHGRQFNGLKSQEVQKLFQGQSIAGEKEEGEEPSIRSEEQQQSFFYFLQNNNAQVKQKLIDEGIENFQQLNGSFYNPIKTGLQKMKYSEERQAEQMILLQKQEQLIFRLRFLIQFESTTDISSEPNQYIQTMQPVLVMQQPQGTQEDYGESPQKRSRKGSFRYYKEKDKPAEKKKSDEFFQEPQQ